MRDENMPLGAACTSDGWLLWFKLLEMLCSTASLVLLIYGKYDLATLMLGWALFNRLERIDALVSREIARVAGLRKGK